MSTQKAVLTATHVSVVTRTKPIVMPSTASAARTAVHARYKGARHTANSVSGITISASLFLSASADISSMAWGCLGGQLWPGTSGTCSV